MSSDSEPNVSLEDALERLRQITSELRLVGWVVLFATIADICGAAVATVLAITHPSYRYDYAEVPMFMVLLSFGILVFALFATAWYDRVLRRGNVFFEEISDELEWHVKPARAVERAEPRGDPPNLKARLILRDFARTTDLPLFPGSQGPGIYTILNLAVFVVAATVWLVS